MEHTALYYAQNTASLEVLRFVAELRGLYPNTTISRDRAEYWLAACIEMGRLDTVEYAIQLGAHPRGIRDLGNPRDNSPLRKACMRGHTAISEYLLTHGAGPEQTVAMASEWGRIELIQRLLEAGIPATNALPKASAGGYLDVVRLLLDAGVDPSETVGPKSPLASAIAKEHTAMFTLLVERGAELHADGVAEQCVWRARKGELDSMLLLL
jgi:ankyrin repeat protein